MADAETVEGLRLPPGSRVSVPGRGWPWVWDSGPRPGATTVVLLHGWTSTAALTWRHAMAPLSEQFRVVAPDLRGHGRGIRSWRPFRLEDCADDIAGLIDTLGVGPVIVVGYSMGGPVAQLVWRRRREVVSGLVLCATASNFARTPMSGVVVAATALSLGLAAATLPGVMRAAGMRRVARSTFPPGASPHAGWAAGEWGGADPAGLFGACAALLRFDSTAWVAGIDVPTGVIITDADQTVPPERQHELASAIPGSFSLALQGAHRCCAENPELFVPVLSQACERVDHAVKTLPMPVSPRGPGRRRAPPRRSGDLVGETCAPGDQTPTPPPPRGLRSVPER